MSKADFIPKFKNAISTAQITKNIVIFLITPALLESVNSYFFLIFDVASLHDKNTVSTSTTSNPINKVFIKLIPSSNDKVLTSSIPEVAATASIIVATIPITIVHIITFETYVKVILPALFSIFLPTFLYYFIYIFYCLK